MRDAVLDHAKAMIQELKAVRHSLNSIRAIDVNGCKGMKLNFIKELPRPIDQVVTLIDEESVGIIYAAALARLIKREAELVERLRTVFK